jgi:hypothetical protein
MGVLADYLKTEGERLRFERRERIEGIREWQGSVRRLLATLAGWLDTADAGQRLLGWRLEEDHAASEPLLGQYRCPKLAILSGDGEFFTDLGEVIPRVRFVAATLKPVGRESRAADGMVEVRAGRITTHFLFRWKGGEGDEWFICTHAEWQSRDFGNVHPLTAEAFEVAVLGAVL